MSGESAGRGCPLALLGTPTQLGVGSSQHGRVCEIVPTRHHHSRQETVTGLKIPVRLNLWSWHLKIYLFRNSGPPSHMLHFLTMIWFLHLVPSKEDVVGLCPTFRNHRDNRLYCDSDLWRVPYPEPAERGPGRVHAGTSWGGAIPLCAAEGSYVSCAVTHSGLRGCVSLAKADTIVHLVSAASPWPLAALGRCIGCGVRLAPRLSGTEGWGRGSRPCWRFSAGSWREKNAFLASVPVQGYCSWPEARCFPTVSWARGRTAPRPGNPCTPCAGGETEQWGSSHFKSHHCSPSIGRTQSHDCTLPQGMLGNVVQAGRPSSPYRVVRKGFLFTVVLRESDLH